MTSPRTFPLVILSFLSCAAGIGCTTPRMAPPADIAQASEILPVRDRGRASGLFINEGFKLGNYEVVDVNRKWTSTESTGIGPWSKETKTTGFAYALATNGKKLAGKCSSESRSQGVGGFSWGKLRIACLCEGEAGGAEVLMTDAGRTLKMGGTQYKLEPINTVEGGGTQSDPTGFRADGDEPLGAVEVIHPGQIWLKKGLDDATRAQTTCAFAGLMLYKAPTDDLTK